MLAPTTVSVQFKVTILREGHFTSPFHGYGDVLRDVELRAEVTFRSAKDDPEVVPLEKARWQDELGDEIAGVVWNEAGERVPLRNEDWVAAEERAIDAAVELVLTRMRQAS